MELDSRENRKTYEAFASACVRGEAPACAVACPLNLDVRDIVRRVQDGNFTAAYKTYRVKAVFPEIVAAICDEPCRAGCVRKDLDESISLRLLEKACVDFARTKNIPAYNLPGRPERVAVVGAGLSGLACAVKLAAKSYPVTVYEKSGRLGGRLWDLLDPAIFLPSLDAQIDASGCEVRLDTEITSLEGLESASVVVATGAGGDTFGLAEGLDPQSFGTNRPGVFLVGSALGTTPVEDIAQGRIAAFSVEKYLKVGAMDGIPETFRQTRCTIEMDMARVESRPAVRPAEPGAFGAGEAPAEAARCLLCDCTFCSDACEVFSAVRRTPKQMVTDAVASLQSTKSGGSVRAMSSCNLCGLCGRVCPQGIDFGRFYADFRVFKREDGLLPPAFHQFFMNDMRHANEDAYLARTAPGRERASHLFFPGCQLPASDPRHVELTYHHLLERIPDMALILGCCGAPAEWAADTALTHGVTEKLAADWERFGRPTFVFACPTCKLQFERRLPDIAATSLYDLLLEVGSPASTTGGEEGREACVFDPCSSRGDPAMQRSVRAIAEAAGIELTELPYSGEKAQCCGWGGHVAVANPSLMDRMVGDRAAEDPRPYVTYCANCQEVFSRGGKASRHILDVVFGLDAARDEVPSLGQRRANRLLAKRAVLEREWGVDMGDAEGAGDAGGVGSPGEPATSGAGAVAISDELLKRMYVERILEDDAYKAVEYCESTGGAVYDPGRDLYIGHLRLGAITLWVEYAKSGDGIVLSSVFYHRAEILEH